MGNLIKYELKGNFKIFIGLFIITCLVNLGLYSRVDVWPSAAVYSLVLVVISIMCVMVLVFNINSFSKELYEDRGYLTFTLPVSGNKIIGSKTIAALIWFTAAGILTALTILFFKGKVDWSIISEINKHVNLPLVITMSIIAVIVNALQLLFTIYFVITASKVAVKKKKIGKFLGFVLFIALNAGIGYVAHLITKLIPYTFSVDLSRQTHNALVYTSDAFLRISQNGLFEMNIAVIIYTILITIGLFIGTGYLIDNKIDM
ncbi:hypothetical protein [Clostridium ganghwense]|uniref:ABC transporter permease n=1 Tax=Clostridium ganghwense TaxID=312089 RepID=A0ABT4CUI5_9CLOT|nr:hypothetical protein [Clostridium ganghwense]MCY6372735.1 hypothetical protein [Clostridium ganghwense]